METKEKIYNRLSIYSLKKSFSHFLKQTFLKGDKIKKLFFKWERLEYKIFRGVNLWKRKAL